MKTRIKKKREKNNKKKAYQNSNYKINDIIKKIPVR